MRLLSRIFSPKPTGLHCPRCEKPLEGHDEAACARRMSRRFFFGALAGGVAAAAVVPRIPTGGLFDPVVDIAADYAVIRETSRTFLLTPDMILDEAMKRYYSESIIMQLTDGRHDPHWLSRPIHGDTISIRLRTPPLFTSSRTEI